MIGSTDPYRKDLLLPPLLGMDMLLGLPQRCYAMYGYPCDSVDESRYHITLNLMDTHNQYPYVIYSTPYPYTIRRFVL